MFRATAKAAIAAVRAMERTARPVTRRMATTTEHASADSMGGVGQRVARMLEIPTWGLFGLGAAGAGFFGKMLHDDNLATRRELQAIREEIHQDKVEIRAEIHQDKVETRADMQKLEDRMDKRFTEMGGTLKEISAQLATSTVFKPRG